MMMKKMSCKVNLEGTNVAWDLGTWLYLNE